MTPRPAGGPASASRPPAKATLQGSGTASLVQSVELGGRLLPVDNVSDLSNGDTIQIGPVAQVPFERHQILALQTQRHAGDAADEYRIVIHGELTNGWPRGTPISNVQETSTHRELDKERLTSPGVWHKVFDELPQCYPAGATPTEKQDFVRAERLMTFLVQVAVAVLFIGAVVLPLSASVCCRWPLLVGNASAWTFFSMVVCCMLKGIAREKKLTLQSRMHMSQQVQPRQADPINVPRSEEPKASTLQLDSRTPWSKTATNSPAKAKMTPEYMPLVPTGWNQALEPEKTTPRALRKPAHWDTTLPKEGPVYYAEPVRILTPHMSTWKWIESKFRRQPTQKSKRSATAARSAGSTFAPKSQAAKLSQGSASNSPSIATAFQPAPAEEAVDPELPISSREGDAEPNFQQQQLPAPYRLNDEMLRAHQHGPEEQPFLQEPRPKIVRRGKVRCTRCGVLLMCVVVLVIVLLAVLPIPKVIEAVLHPHRHKVPAKTGGEEGGENRSRGGAWDGRGVGEEGRGKEANGQRGEHAFGKAEAENAGQVEGEGKESSGRHARSGKTSISSGHHGRRPDAREPAMPSSTSAAAKKAIPQPATARRAKSAPSPSPGWRTGGMSPSSRLALPPPPGRMEFPSSTDWGDNLIQRVDTLEFDSSVLFGFSREHMEALSQALDFSNAVLVRQAQALQMDVASKLEALVNLVREEQGRALLQHADRSWSSSPAPSPKSSNTNGGKPLQRPSPLSLSSSKMGVDGGNMNPLSMPPASPISPQTLVPNWAVDPQAQQGSCREFGIAKPPSLPLELPGSLPSPRGAPVELVGIRPLGNHVDDPMPTKSKKFLETPDFRGKESCELVKESQSIKPSNGNATSCKGANNEDSRSHAKCDYAKETFPKVRGSMSRDARAALEDKEPTLNHSHTVNMNGRGVFAGNNQDAMKDKVRTALVKPQYNCQDYYFDEGIAQYLAKNSVFEMVTLGVIAFNSIWLAVEADLNPSTSLSGAAWHFQAVEHFFCTFFSLELLIRYCAFKKTKYALSDAWFCFDSCLVTMMIAETWIMNTILFHLYGTQGIANGTVLRLIRMARLTRMARMVRLLRWMQELVVLLKGLGLASKSVFFTLLLLCIIIYIFALTFRQLTEDDKYHCDDCIGEKYFKTTMMAFVSLLWRGTLPDLADFVYNVAEEDFALAFILVVFVLLATITVMNMLVGVLVEVVAMVSTIENESIMVSMVRQKMHEMITILQLDSDGNMMISKSEFEALLVNPAGAQFMQEVGVDVVGLVEFADFIFKDRELFFHEFVELILQLRGTNTATVRDLVDLRRFITMELDRRDVGRTVVEEDDKARLSITSAAAINADPTMRFAGRKSNRRVDPPDTSPREVIHTQSSPRELT